MMALFIYQVKQLLSTYHLSSHNKKSQDYIFDIFKTKL